MTLSREARLVAGLTLLAIPTIMYGGVTLLGILTKGTAGIAPGSLALDETQWALFRAGMPMRECGSVLSLVIQVLLDSATLSSQLKWLARLAAPLAAIAISAGFFGLAYNSNFTHVAFELGLIGALVGAWNRPEVAAKKRLPRARLAAL